jgi:uncharacterized membrane protein
MIPKPRLDALTDGMFAVAMTLLVIDLRLPENCVRRRHRQKSRRLMSATSAAHNYTGKVRRLRVMNLIGAKFARALVISAAIASALTPVACLAEGAPALPEKATRELPAALLSLLAHKKDAQAFADPAACLQGRIGA